MAVFFNWDTMPTTLTSLSLVNCHIDDDDWPSTCPSGLKDISILYKPGTTVPDIWPAGAVVEEYRRVEDT
jgi:hypothetical protein